MQPLKHCFEIFVNFCGKVTDDKFLQLQFVAHIDNQQVVRNTVEKSDAGCFENVKSYRFNNFNFV